MCTFLRNSRNRFFFFNRGALFSRPAQPAWFPRLPAPHVEPPKSAHTSVVTASLSSMRFPLQQSLLYELMAHPGARPEYEDPATVSQVKELEVAAMPDEEATPSEEDVLHQSGRRWQMTQTVLPDAATAEDVLSDEDVLWDDDPEMTEFLRRQVGQTAPPKSRLMQGFFHWLLQFGCVNGLPRPVLEPDASGARGQFQTPAQSRTSKRR